jgi:hypothetical protein
MERRILVQRETGRICDIAPTPFDVHPDFEWIDASAFTEEDATLTRMRWVDGKLAPPPPDPNADVIARCQQFARTDDVTELTDRLRSSTPGEIDEFVGNVTTLAHARHLIGMMLKYLVARGL